MKPKFFATPEAFRKWLEKNHDKATELIVGYYKIDSGKRSMTWSQSVDEALCFGWIDGVRHSIDAISYQNRFTPRKPGSNWSAINIKKVEVLTKNGLMHQAGIAAFQKRTSAKSTIYTYENEEVAFSPAFEKIFKANRKAWRYFQALAPSYQKLSKRWVMSAKQEATREKRLQAIIAQSESGTNMWKDNKYKK